MLATMMTGLFTAALLLFTISIDIGPAIAQIQETLILPIQGGEDDEESNCQVYEDVNEWFNPDWC